MENRPNIDSQKASNKKMPRRTRLGGVLEASWGVLEASWRRLGGILGHLGASWRRLGGVLEASWRRLGPLKSTTRADRDNGGGFAEGSLLGSIMIFRTL